MTVDITKIQFLSERDSGHPILYCHANDENHFPHLTASLAADGSIALEMEDTVFKVKANPQRKNRVDIYMSIESANQLGRELIAVCPRVTAARLPVNNTNPHAVASGRMALPNITWSRSARFSLALAKVRSGTTLQKRNGTMYVELETPAAGHIMMRDAEIHLGLALDAPTGRHDPRETTPCVVPEHELQRGTGETNPVHKVIGTFSVFLEPDVALGLGQLLSTAAP